MNKYIDSEKLIAEIEKWRDKAKEKYNESTYSMGRCDALAEFRNHIVSLLEEQPEVELNEETMINEFRVIRDKCFNEGIEGWQREKLIAFHFYELGLNARKEE